MQTQLNFAKDDIRDILLANEVAYAQILKESGRKYSSQNKNGFIRAMRHDGDLIDYIRHSMSEEDSRTFKETIGGPDFLTCRDIIDEYVTYLKVHEPHKIDDYSSFDELIEGNKYTSYDIGTIIKNYDIQRGMKFVVKDGRECVFIKATLENHESEQGYFDHWIKEGKILLYYSEREDSFDAMKNYTYRKKPNKKIFDSIINNATDSLDIYVFTRTKNSGGYPFTFNGIFHALAPVEGQPAFKLGKADLPKNDRDVVEITVDWETNWMKRPVKEMLSQKAPLELDRSSPRREESDQVAEPQEEDPSIIFRRDYIDEAKRKQKIGEMGEEAVLEWEKKKIRKALENDPKTLEYCLRNVRQVSELPGGERFGYDIESFDIVNGVPKRIYIEVKTTTSSNKARDFFITQHELAQSKSEKIGDNYYIYRVYNITGYNPRFFKIKGDPLLSNFVRLTPYIWLAKIA